MNLDQMSPQELQQLLKRTIDELQSRLSQADSQTDNLPTVPSYTQPTDTQPIDAQPIDTQPTTNQTPDAPTTEVTDRPVETTKPPAITDNFSVSDGQIIGPDGKPFVARGINVNGISANEYADDILKSFPNLNFIRLATSPDGNPFTGETGAPQQAVLDDVQKFIDKMTAHGIVVEVENHGGSEPSGQELQNEIDWVSQIAARNKDNPYVWFGSHNEPVVRNSDFAATVNEQQQFYDAIRATGNNNMIMLETGIYTWPGIGSFTENKELSNYKNVAIDFHWYSADYGASSASLLDENLKLFDGIKSADGQMPIIMGEYGPTAGEGGNPDVVGGQQSIEAVQNAVNDGKLDGAVAWQFGRVGASLDDPTGANAWTDTDSLPLFPHERGVFGGLSEWGNEVANWIDTGRVGDTSKPATAS
ncbi:MAG: cellulase family glycosylhydrolase [Cyanobacteria bacterium SZAS TMP-1]|nr:cellulase family glycosylhydrolase [Cyanobacteria bacterium SZAS TMP-1]